MSDVLERVLERRWFYEFELPDGRRTECYLPPAAQAVHTTRRSMMEHAIRTEFGEDLSGLRAADLACHQGYFSIELARRGCAEVLGVDAREDHVRDAALMGRALNLENFVAERRDVFDLDAGTLGKFDIVLMFGLLYHLENPIGALRVARSLTRGTCLVETQVAPNLSGPLDWGHYDFVKPMMGSFAVIDETEETHGPEMSTLGICLAPSVEALTWIMGKVGFSRVAVLEPPEGAYEQHRHGKRVMVAGYS